MNFLFKGEIIDYNYTFANSKHTILFLHGWGGNKNSFRSTINLLKNKFNILTITLPTIKATVQVWTLYDYAFVVENILKLHSVNQVTIICHSFGFRVACLLNGKILIKKLVITGGAGLKKKNYFKKIETDNNKILLSQKKFHYLYDSIASKDYKSLSNTNKKTFNNVIGVNTKNFIKFDCPILLFWGTRDKETKLWIAKKIKKVNHAKLITTKLDHFAYIKENSYFNHCVIKFLKI